jgi:ABC-type transport system involved in multi-copper enzyme maturation permease subunit
MGINNLGYRKWELIPKIGNHQWTTITIFGVRVAWRSNWLRRIFLLAWLPILVMGAGLFILEQSIQDVDSKEFPMDQGRPVVSFIIMQRPEIFNIVMITSIKKQFDNVATQLTQGVLGMDVREDTDMPESGGMRPQGGMFGGEISFDVEDLKFVADMSPEMLNMMFEQTTDRMMGRIGGGRGGQPGQGPPTLFKQSKHKLLRSQEVARELLEYDVDDSGVIEFRELVDYMRPTLWAQILFTFFIIPQAFSVVIVIGMVAPKLISRDMKNRAFLLYYSRPIKPSQYLLGKCAIVWVFLIGLTTLPALMLYCMGVALSPSMSVLLVTWDLPLRIIVASVVLCVPTTLFALTLSSLTRESIFASFVWFAVWIMGSIAYGIMTFVEGVVRMNNNVDQSLNFEASRFRSRLDGNWSWLSPLQTLENLQSWVFGMDQETGSIGLAFALVSVVCVICLLILRRRIVAPIRV